MHNRVITLFQWHFRYVVSVCFSLQLEKIRNRLQYINLEDATASVAAQVKKLRLL